MNKKVNGNFYLNNDGTNFIGYKEVEYSSLTFNPEDFDTKEEFNNAIRDFILLLVKTGNVMRVRGEEKLIIVEYTHDNSIEYYGGTNLVFVTEKENEELGFSRQEEVWTLRDALGCEEDEDDEDEEDEEDVE